MKLTGLQGWLLYLLVLGIAAYWYSLKEGPFIDIGALDYKVVLLLAPLILTSLLIIGLSNQIIAVHLGAPLSFSQWSSLAFASTFASHFLPMKAGMGIRAAYYKIYSKLPLSHFASLTILLFIISFTASSIIGLLTCLALLLNNTTVYWQITVMFAALLIASILMFFGRIPRLPVAYEKIRQIEIQVHEGWALCRQRPQLILLSLGLNISLTLLYAVRLYVAFMATGLDVSLLGCTFLSALVGVSGIISITPAALGIREATIVLGSTVLGVSPEISLLAGVIDRAVSVVIIAALGSVGLMKVQADIARALKPAGTPST